MRKETCKLTNCKSCQKEIAKSVKKCSTCGHDQRNFFMQHKAIIGILLLELIGTNGGTGNSKTTPVPNSNVSVATSAQVEKAPVVKHIHGINEAVKSNNTTVKVINVKKLKSGKYDKPKSGMEFVVVTVLIGNTGTSEITYSSFDFKLKNSQGQITDEAITSIGSDTQLPSASLDSKGEIIGTIVFEQHINDTDLVLEYSDSLSNNSIQFKLDIF